MNSLIQWLRGHCRKISDRASVNDKFAVYFVTRKKDVQVIVGYIFIWHV